MRKNSSRNYCRVLPNPDVPELLCIIGHMHVRFGQATGLAFEERASTAVYSECIFAHCMISTLLQHNPKACHAFSSLCTAILEFWFLTWCG